MTPRRISYPKEHLAEAKRRGKTAFAIGFSGPKYIAEAFMWLDDDTARLLWTIAMGVNLGMTPRQALQEAEDGAAGKVEVVS